MLGNSGQVFKNTKHLPEYVSYIDDPRIDIAMAEEFLAVKLEYFEEFEIEFLEKKMKELNESLTDDILFPIQSEDQLEKRLIELLAYSKGEVDNPFFSLSSFLRLIYKVSSKDLEERIGFYDHYCGKYGNPELIYFKKIYDEMLNDSLSVDFFIDRIDFDKELDMNFENNHFDLKRRMKSFVSGLIFSRTKRGDSIISESIKEENQIQRSISDQRLMIQMLSTQLKHKNALEINADDSQKQIARGRFSVVNDIPKTSDTDVFDPKQDDLVILSVDGFEVKSGHLRLGKLDGTREYKLVIDDQSHSLRFIL